MTKNSSINRTINNNGFIIEMYQDFKEKLDIAELVLKTLGIEYHITTYKTQASNLRTSLLRKSLAQIHDELTNFKASGDDDKSGIN
ncbi:MAG: hypothetical protein ACFFCY_13215 [Promethearchaeota archaeon]